MGFYWCLGFKSKFSFAVDVAFSAPMEFDKSLTVSPVLSV